MFARKNNLKAIISETKEGYRFRLKGTGTDKMIYELIKLLLKELFDEYGTEQILAKLVHDIL